MVKNNEEYIPCGWCRGTYPENYEVVDIMDPTDKMVVPKFIAKYCPFCGKRLDDETQRIHDFESDCGKRLDDETQQ